MLIVSTTTNFCAGDDFIRDGVRRLLGTHAASGEVWLDRTGAGPGKQRWHLQTSLADIDSLFAIAEAFVMAGTPGWLNYDVSWIDLCLRHRTPVWLIGVSSHQHHEARLPEVAPLIAVATVRDAGAAEVMEAAGVPYRRFLEPGFHAPYFQPLHKVYDIVLTYRHRGAHHEVEQEAREDAYRAIFEQFRHRIDRVVVHEPHEIPEAIRLFGVEPFHSSDPRRYTDIYCRAKHYIGGRLHGAVPVLACGGDAHLLYANPKTEALTAEAAWLPCRVVTHPDWRDIEPGLPADDVAGHLRRDYCAHAAYLAEALA